MRLRKQSRPAPEPGAEFLRAVSSGPPIRQHAPRPSDDGGLRRQVLESERRAAAAEEALRQIREESHERLDKARRALARERAARIAIENELLETYEHDSEAELAPEPQRESEPDLELEPEPEPEPDPEPVPVDDEPEPAPTTEPPADPAPQTRSDHPGDDVSEEGEWPAPWLDPPSSPPRRLFRRPTP